MVWGGIRDREHGQGILGSWDSMGMAMGMGHLAAAGFVNLLAICCSWPAKLMPN